MNCNISLIQQVIEKEDRKNKWAKFDRTLVERPNRIEYYVKGIIKYDMFLSNPLTGTIKRYYYTTNYLKYSHQYANGLLDGYCEGYYPNGQIRYKMNYKEGLIHGNYKHYNFDTLEFDCNYYNGKYHGECIWFFENSNNLMYGRSKAIRKLTHFDPAKVIYKTTINYDMGKRNGKMKKFEGDKLIYDAMYKYNELMKAKYYD